MHRILRAIAIVLLFIGGAFAQQKTPPATPTANQSVPVKPLVTSVSVSYVLPDAEQKKMRRLEAQIKDLEAQNQAMLVKIEKNKQDQKEKGDAIRAIAFEYATKNKIDLDKYELNLAGDDISFTEKKVQAK